MGMPGLRRPREEGDETHEFTGPPRDFVETEDGGYAFTIAPGDLTPPLTTWLEQDEPVRVDYHTDLDAEPKASFRLRPERPGRTSAPGWTEEPTRVVLEPVH